MSECMIAQSVTSATSALDYVDQSESRNGFVAANFDKKMYEGCRKCRGSGGTIVEEGGYKTWRPCVAATVHEGVRKITRAQIPSSFVEARLADFAEPTQLQKACAPIGQWLRKPRVDGGFWIYGAVGRGKSHLAAAVAKSVAMSGQSVQWHDGPDLFRQQRQTFSGGQKGSEDAIERCMGVDLLVLDDIDKVRITDWTHEQLWLLLKARLERNRAIIFTSNVRAGDWCKTLPFGQPLLSRLYQRVTPILLPGDDRRRVEGW